MSILGFSDEGGNGHLLVAGKQDFRDARAFLATRLLETTPQNQGKWQQLDVSKSSVHDTYELLNVTLMYQMPQTVKGAQKHINPDLPWSEAHFQERVGRKPINPGVEHANWPYHANGADLHLKNGMYDHNYMERMWPTDLKLQTDLEYEVTNGNRFTGYRFAVGDLDDVVTQLASDPGTRQAYLPIWFPEDTGATAGQRVPCSLGYHFIIRDGLLHVQYNLRSCEIYRHFTNDIYMAVRLGQWVAEQLALTHNVDVKLGQLTTHVVSLHGFVGDTAKIEELA
jgi:thymidylate synthase